MKSENIFTEFLVSTSILKIEYRTANPESTVTPPEKPNLFSLRGEGRFVKHSAKNYYLGTELPALFPGKAITYESCEFGIIRRFERPSNSLKAWPAHAHVIFMDHTLQVFIEANDILFESVYSDMPWNTHDLVWNLFIPENQNPSVNLRTFEGPYLNRYPSALPQVGAQSGLISGYANLESLVARQFSEVN